MENERKSSEKNRKGWLSFLGITRGSGEMTEETRKLEPFHAVSLDMRGDLFVELGEQEQIRIEAEDNLIGKIETVVKNGVLKIDTGSGLNVFFSQPVKFTLTARSLDRLQTTSSGNIHAPDLTAASFEAKTSGSGFIEIASLKTDSLRCEISSSGRIIFKSVSAPSLKAQLSGSGDLILLDGILGSQSISLSSSGRLIASDVKAFPEKAALVEVQISGSGNAETGEIHTDLLDARLSSSGKLIIPHAKVREVRANLSGSGNMVIENGSVEAQEIRLSSAGKYLAPGLKPLLGGAEHSSVKISGSGQAELGKVVVETFEAVLESSGGLSVEELFADVLQVKSSGSGDMVVEAGVVRQPLISLSSEGKMIAGGLESAEKSAERVKISLSGSGSARIGSIRGDLTALSIHSSGSLSIRRVDANVLEGRLDGSGDLQIAEGEAKELDLRLESSGKCLMDGVRCHKAQVVSSGSGDMQIQVEKNLKLKIESSGNVELIGSPNMEVSVDGSGKLNQYRSRQEKASRV